VIRELAVDYLKRHWRQMPRLYLWIKPARLITTVAEIVRKAESRRLSATGWLAIGLIVAASMMQFGIAARLPDHAWAVALASLALLVSVPAPQIWAYPYRDVCGAPSWLLVAVPPMLIGLLAGYLWGS
jgi:hypothetical protein